MKNRSKVPNRRSKSISRRTKAVSGKQSLSLQNTAANTRQLVAVLTRPVSSGANRRPRFMKTTIPEVPIRYSSPHSHTAAGPLIAAMVANSATAIAEWHL